MLDLYGVDNLPQSLRLADMARRADHPYLAEGQDAVVGDGFTGGAGL
jgi:hypothetical protein